MAKNDFLVFDESQTNTLTQAEYEADPQRIGGVVSGVARSNIQNKALHQATIFAAAFGQVIANEGKNASDQDVVALTSQIKDLVGNKGCIVIADNGTQIRIGCDEIGFYWEVIEEMTEPEIDNILASGEYDDADGNAGALSNADIDQIIKGVEDNG